MTEIPIWWFVLSALFFLANIALFVVVGYGVWRVVRVVEELKPRVEGLTERVSEVAVSVNGVARRVDEVALSVRNTVDGVGTRVRSITTRTDDVVQGAAPLLARVAPVLGVAVTALKVLQTANGFRRALFGGGRRKRRR